MGVNEEDDEDEQDTLPCFPLLAFLRLFLVYIARKMTSISYILKFISFSCHRSSPLSFRFSHS